MRYTIFISALIIICITFVVIIILAIKDPNAYINKSLYYNDKSKLYNQKAQHYYYRKDTIIGNVYKDSALLYKDSFILLDIKHDSINLNN